MQLAVEGHIRRAPMLNERATARCECLSQRQHGLQEGS
jgi:hypothetical protein